MTITHQTDRVEFFRRLMDGETPPPDLPLPAHRHVQRIPAADPVAEQWEQHADERTVPWADDELLYIDGVPHVYAADRLRGVTVVFLPGGRRALLSSLRLAADVQLPKRVRYSTAVSRADVLGHTPPASSASTAVLVRSGGGSARGAG